MERTTLRKELTGIVVSDKMDKTVVVAATNKKKHPLYKKTITKTTKFKAHDENNECGVGDTVRIVETRKLSKDKNWRVAEIIERRSNCGLYPHEFMYGRKRAPAECLFLNIKKYCFHDCLHAGKTRRTASLSAIKACEKICVRRGNPLERFTKRQATIFVRIRG